MKKEAFSEAVRREGDRWALYPCPGNSRHAAEDPLSQDTREYYVTRARVYSRKSWPVSLRHRMLAGVSA